MRYDVETVLAYGGEGVRFSGMLTGNMESRLPAGCALLA